MVSMKENALSWKGLGFALGILWGVYLGLAALLAMTGIQVVGFSSTTFELLQNIYPLLTASWNGVLVGLGTGLVCGVICGSIFGWLYNTALSLRMNLSANARLWRLVLGIILIYAGDYAGSIAGGFVFLIGAVSIAESIIGYCGLMQAIKK